MAKDKKTDAPAVPEGSDQVDMNDPTAAHLKEAPAEEAPVAPEE
jgi:hypothetical protein